MEASEVSVQCPNRAQLEKLQLENKRLKAENERLKQTLKIVRIENERLLEFIGG
nr:MAG TPA: integrating conjugative element protein [Caudoviricetes sp.]